MKKMSPVRKIEKADDLQCLFLRSDNTGRKVTAIADTVNIFHSENLSPIRANSALKQIQTLHNRIAIVVDGFTDKHKKAMKSIRNEMAATTKPSFNSDLLILDPPIRQVTNGNRNRHENYEDMINELSRKIGYPKCITADAKSEESVLSYDYMSGVWRMLQSDCNDKVFCLSPKGYEFDKSKAKWVPRTSEFLQEIEASRNKCEEWLAKTQPPQLKRVE